MGSIIDLNGGTHTVTMDSTETLWKFIDSSTLHNGTIIVQSGAKVLFEDEADSGFDASCSAITLTTQGEADAFASIKSVETMPHNPWKLPPTTATLSLVRTYMRGCYGEKGPLWTYLNVVWGGDGYCTVNDVRAMTGIQSEGTTGVDDFRIELFIKNASDEIDELTGRVWDQRTATVEVHDYEGAEWLTLDHWPILTIASVEYRTGDITWETKTMGPDGDYWASEDDREKGIIRLIVPPTYNLQAIRVTYDYGATVTPYKVRKVCMTMAAIQTYRAASSPGTANIYQLDIDSLQEQIDAFIKSLGGELELWVPKMPPEKMRRGTRWEKLWQ